MQESLNFPRHQKDIISLADQYKTQVSNKKNGVKIGSRLYQCTCCICGKVYTRHIKESYFCDNSFCQKVRKSVADSNYRKSEVGQATRRKNRKTPRTIETRKRYEQSEQYKKSKSIRSKYYKQNERTVELDKARKLRYYYRKYSGLRSVTIVGADFISFEDWKKLYSADTCYYCGKQIQGRDKTVDHKIPISKGGTNKFENLCMCCQSCNSKKNNKTEEEFYKYLREGA